MPIKIFVQSAGYSGLVHCKTKLFQVFKSNGGFGLGLPDQFGIGSFCHLKGTAFSSEMVPYAFHFLTTHATLLFGIQTGDRFIAFYIFFVLILDFLLRSDKFLDFVTATYVFTHSRIFPTIYRQNP